MVDSLNIQGKQYVVRRSSRQGKKFRVDFADGSSTHFGARGARIARGTPKGDSYCARSAKIPRKQGVAYYKSPNYLSRKKWGCRGSVSVRASSRARAYERRKPERRG